MNIQHDSRDVIITALEKLLEQHGYNKEILDVSGFNVTIHLNDTKKDKDFGNSLKNKFFLKYTSDLDEVNRQRLLETYSDNTIVYFVKETLLVFDFKLTILNGESSNGLHAENVSNVKYFTNKYLEVDTTLFSDLKIPDIFDDTLKNIKNCRLKTLNFKSLMELVESSLYEFAIMKITDPTFRNKDDLLNVSYWNVINYNNSKDKVELIIYLSYLTLKNINSGISVKQAINNSLNLSNFDLKIICSFYGELAEVNNLYNQYISTYNLDESFIDEQTFELSGLEDNDAELSQIILKFIDVIYTELGVLLPESASKELLGTRYKKLNKFNNEGIPQITNDINNNLISLVTYCSNKISENSNIPLSDVRDVAENLIKNKKFINQLSIVNVKEILESINSKSNVTSKFYKLLLDEVNLVGLMEANSDKLELYENLILNIESSIDIENQLGDILSKLKTIEDMKVLNKTQLSTIENKLTSKVSLRTNELIRDEKLEDILKLYRIIFKGGN